MARVQALAAGRTAPNTTLVVWGGITLLGSLLLPWFREGREFGTFLWETTGLALLPRSALVAVIALLGALAAVTGLAPRSNAARGRAAVLVGIAGTLLSIWFLLSAGRPFGAATLVAALGFLTVLGTGLALSGRLRADAFVAASILWVSAFVVVFILFPLWTVLKASVVVQGRLTLQVLRETLASPGFLLVNNPATPRNESAISLVAGVVISVAALAGLAALGRPLRRALFWAGAAGLGGGVLTALYLGHGALRNSLLLAVLVGAISTALAFLFALMGERSRLRTKTLLGPFSILPIITPPFVLGLAMIFLFGRRGFITHQLLGLSTNVFFGPLGVAVAQILAYTPIAFLVLQGVIQSMDAALEEAAETLGASRWHMLRTVIWPLARPGIANAFLLVAIESLADFGNPIIVGGGAPFLATEVFFAIVGRFNPSEASVYGVVLLLMTLTIFLIQRVWLGRGSYVTLTGRPSGARFRLMPPALDYGVSAVFLFWMALIVLLYGSVFVGSITQLWGINYTLTWEHIRNLSPQGWAVFWTSMRLSAYAMIPSMLLGFLIGYLVTRVEFPGRDALEFGSMLSFAVPGTVMGIGYILAFNQGALLLTGTQAIIILAFIFRNMPVGIRSSIAAIHQIDRSLEEASTMLRANSVTTLRRIVIPLTLSALLSGLIFAFVRAMTAVSQVIFLITAGTNLATTQIFTYVEAGRLGRGAALASLLTVAMVAVILLLYLLNQLLSRWMGVRAAMRLDTRTAGEIAGT
jgi:iron(III) transport system permease protein